MQSVFVTGADKGLGFCLADTFAREGFRVFAGHLDDGAALAKLATSREGRVAPVRQDVTDMASIRSSAETVAGLTDGLDILINCAGISPPEMRRRLEELDLTNGLIEQIMAVNAFGPLRVTQAFMPLLERGSLKKIVTITSEAASIGDNWRDFDYAYCMSKSACNMLGQILQRAVKPRGFKVLLVHPGWMRTDMGGPTAHITPETAAEGIFTQTMRTWSLDDPIYMDYNGGVMRW